MKQLFFTILIYIILIVIVFVGSFIFMFLWNCCIPALFGLPEITWLQSFCLVALIKYILPDIKVKVKEKE